MTGDPFQSGSALLRYCPLAAFNRIMAKTFFITGAGSGIGRVLARYLLLRDHRVFLTDYNRDFLEQTCTSHLRSILPQEQYANVKWAQMNVTDDEEVANAIALCVAKFGGIDVLVNSKFPAFTMLA